MIKLEQDCKFRVLIKAEVATGITWRNMGSGGRSPLILTSAIDPVTNWIRDFHRLI